MHFLPYASPKSFLTRARKEFMGRVMLLGASTELCMRLVVSSSSRQKPVSTYRLRRLAIARAVRLIRTPRRPTLSSASLLVLRSASFVFVFVSREGCVRASIHRVNHPLLTRAYDQSCQVVVGGGGENVNKRQRPKCEQTRERGTRLWLRKLCASSMLKHSN